MKKREMRLGIVADDLSGAMDTGLQFAKRGLKTFVALAEGDFAAVEALAVTTESRHVAAAEARERVKDAARYMRGRKVYKKIDSTLRGHVGPEIQVLMRELEYERAIIAPAFPEQGRTVADGQLFVFGRPLHRADLARSARQPILSSHVGEILTQQTGAVCGHVELYKVERGPWGLVRALESQASSLIVVDAVTREHLDTIARAIVLSEGRWLPCGSAGLAQSLAQILAPAGKLPLEPPAATGRPALIVAGSRQSTTAEQIREARKRLGLMVLPLPARGEAGEADTMETARAQLAGGRSVILAAPDDVLRGGEKRIAEGLARLARALWDASMLQPGGELAGLILTGGDIALATCHALEVAAIRLADEIEPGVPVGVLEGGVAAGARVITKAGGFGSREVFIKAIRYLQGGTG